MSAFSELGSEGAVPTARLPIALGFEDFHHGHQRSQSSTPFLRIFPALIVFGEQLLFVLRRSTNALVGPVITAANVRKVRIAEFY
jgi:hypothetical protein